MPWGLYHLASGDHERALEALAAALEVPEDGRKLAALGLVHWHRGELDSCEERWKQALRLSASDVDLAFRLGTVAERLGEGEKARLWFEYADRLGPGRR